MNFEQLLTKFNQGIAWNAYLYLIYKITSTIVTILLFSYLEPNHFSAWANSYSIIYLVLLWADFGLRKSLPRYLPAFAHNQLSAKHFLRKIIIFELIVLTCLLPLIMIAAAKIARAFAIADISVIYAIAAIFALEGMVAIVRIIFHSHFWQKSFNILSTVTMTAETAFNIFFIVTMSATSITLLKAVLYAKIIASASLLVIGLYMLKKFYTHQQQEQQSIIDSKVLMKEFVQHSAVMWGNTILKSFSERNFMLPLLTIIAGPTAANIFKVANDGALLFQRIIIKTIGTTDTSLLTHVHALPEEKNLTNVAFQKLSAKIATLCLPLLGVIGLCIAMAPYHLRTSIGFQLFYSIAISYSLETMLVPFERLLEVKRVYWYLAGAYLFYISILSLLLASFYGAWIGLYSFILLVCIVRLVSLLLMSWISYKLFELSLSYRAYRFLASLAAKTLGVTVGVYVLFLPIIRVVPAMRDSFPYSFPFPIVKEQLIALARVVMKGS